MGTHRTPRSGGDRFDLQPLEGRTLLSIAPALGFSLPNTVPGDMASDAQGNLYLVGKFTGKVDFNLSPRHTFTLNAKLGGAFLAKYTSAGVLLWATQSDAPFNAVATDTIGNVYTCGTFGGTYDFDPTPVRQLPLTAQGKRDAFVAKYRGADGAVLWANKIGGPGDEVGFDVAVDGRGFVHVHGTTGPATSLPSLTITLDLFTPRGKNVYDYRFGDPVYASYGAGMAVDPAGDTYLAGSSYASLDYDPSPTVINSLPAHSNFLLKLDPSGQLKWVNSGGDFGVGDPGTYADIAADDSGVYLTGYYDFSPDFDPRPDHSFMLPGQGAFLAKYSPTGAFVFANPMLHFPTLGRKVAIDPQTADVYVLGNFSSFTTVSDATHQIRLTTSTNGLFLARYSSTGQLLDAVAASTDYDLGYHINLAAAPNGVTICTSLTSYDPADWDPGAGTLMLKDGLVVRYRGR
jgi:hypothetical protein